MTEEYTPDEDGVRRVYVYAMCAHGYPQGQPDAEFGRFIAQVKRTAAREALGGLAREEEEHSLRYHAKELDWAAEQCAHARTSAEDYRDTHHPIPEESP